MLEKYPLPYSFDAVAPFVSEDTMRTHYEKHYNAYWENANAELQKHGIEPNMTDIIEYGSYDTSKRLRNNFGGYYNHSLFWFMLRPIKSGYNTPEKETARLISRDFGSLRDFKDAFIKESNMRFGSGWVWWVIDPQSGKTKIINTPYQDFPEMPEYGSLIPLLGIDVWEHAYYLDYKNERKRYVTNILDNAVNWAYVEQRIKEMNQLP